MTELTKDGQDDFGITENTEAFETEVATSNQQIQSQQDSEVEPDYDFVQQPDSEYFCPVSSELLVEPHQTSCCGQHISQQAANRLIREQKPCPMCKDDEFNTQVDKYFTRKVRQLKVRCPHKKSGCEWTGELGDLNHHTTSCPKRPWKCKYCEFEETYEIGNEHIPVCANYPFACPNQCGVGTFRRRDAEKHLLECPLQLVECEFAGTGCDVKVPQRDLVSHMTENAQHHLMTATLLNLRLTRELHQKMEEKDQQIVELKQKMTELDINMCEEIRYLRADIKKQLKPTPFPQYQHPQNLPLEKPSPRRQPSRPQQRTEGSTRRAQATAAPTAANKVTTTMITLKEFTKQQASSKNGSWYSDIINCEEYQFKLAIETNGFGEARGNHLSAYLRLQAGENDQMLCWPIKVKVKIELLNQRENKEHKQVVGNVLFRKPATVWDCGMIGTNTKSFAIRALGYNAHKHTEYLQNDCLSFNVMLKIEHSYY